MTGDVTKILVLIFFVHTFLFIGQSEANLGYDNTTATNYMYNYAKINVTTSNGTTSVTSTGMGTDDYDIDESGITGGYTSFFNPLASVWTIFTGIIWGLISSPITLFNLPIHWAIKLIALGPLVLCYFLAIVAFLRGGSL